MQQKLTSFYRPILVIEWHRLGTAYVLPVVVMNYLLWQENIFDANSLNSDCLEVISDEYIEDLKVAQLLSVVGEYLVLDSLLHNLFIDFFIVYLGGPAQGEDVELAAIFIEVFLTGNIRIIGCLISEGTLIDIKYH